MALRSSRLTGTVRPDLRVSRRTGTVSGMGDTASPATTPSTRLSMPYLPGLDGLRALAIIGVLLYHADIVCLPGGFLGVDVFFVVSGYLITALLLREHRETGHIRLGQFWIRRARRLLPALMLYLAGSLGLAALFAPDVIDEWREGLWSALAYVANWFGIFNEISYAEGFARKSFLHHLWSLAVEEQFYLLWPVLLWGALRLVGRRGTWFLILAGVGASTWLMWSLYTPLEDPLRVYYGTDTRAGGLLVGAALAFVWRPWEWIISGRVRRGLVFGSTSAVGLAGLAGVGWAMWWYDLSLPTADPLFRGGFLITSGFTALAIAAAVVPRSPFGFVLGLPPIRWVGTRSYGIYLWHWPIFQITRARVDVDLAEGPLLALRLILTLVAAEVSYQLVERPIRERAVRTKIAGLREPGATRRGLALAPLAIAAGIGVVALAQADFSSASELATEEVVVLTEPELRVTEPAPAPESATPSPTALPAPTPVDTRLVLPTKPDSPPVPTPPPTPPTDEGPNYEHVTLIGDSVMEGAAPNILALIPGADIDTLVGRHWFEAIDIVGKRLDDRALGDAVVIHLGNNGPINEEMFDELMEHLVEVELVVVINVRVPLRWEESVNDHLAAGVDRWDNAVLVNWYRRSNEKPQFFAADGVHIEERGRRNYVKAIAKALGLNKPNKPAPAEPGTAAAPSSAAPSAAPSDSGTSPTPVPERDVPPPLPGNTAAEVDSEGGNADGE
jgi:peptidoglycan/LPS O-acetylase OafA/YrhL